MNATTNYYLDAVKDIPQGIKKEVEFSFAISDRIYQLLKEKGMTQKELAKKMNKTESEVSVWVSGQHNFTLRTLARISVILGEDLIQVKTNS